MQKKKSESYLDKEIDKAQKYYAELFTKIRILELKIQDLIKRRFKVRM